jgi:hypothetical protein
MGFGLKNLTTSSGVPLQLTYDGHIEWKPGSVSYDWSTVAAVSGSAVTLAAEQITIPIGQKFLQLGQLMCEITATGLYGPYDPAASDGRQTPARGKCGLMNMTVLQNGVLGITAANTDNGNLLIGGAVWYARLIQAGVGTHSLAAGPTLAELLAVLPRLELRY